MINLTQQEKNVFKSLSQSTEGAVVAGYLSRLMRHLTDELVDSSPTPAQIEGIVLARKTLKDLCGRLEGRDRIEVEAERFS
jgi:ketosteroid isomerase-like protein